MRFMMIVKATQKSEQGVMPTEELMAEMGRYNEQLQKAGILLDAAGLKPTSAGARVHFAGDKKTVVDGPFTETKELIAGYWLIQVASKEEAVQWALRAPNPYFGGEGDVELRQLFEMEDFAP